MQLHREYTLSLFQRHIRLRVADVLVGGADDAVRKLHFLHAVGAPAGHTGNGKQRGEQILADAEQAGRHQTAERILLGQLADRSVGAEQQRTPKAQSASFTPPHPSAAAKHATE